MVLEVLCIFAVSAAHAQESENESCALTMVKKQKWSSRLGSSFCYQAHDLAQEELIWL